MASLFPYKPAHCDCVVQNVDFTTTTLSFHQTILKQIYFFTILTSRNIFKSKFKNGKRVFTSGNDFDVFGYPFNRRPFTSRNEGQPDSDVGRSISDASRYCGVSIQSCLPRSLEKCQVSYVRSFNAIGTKMSDVFVDREWNKNCAKMISSRSESGAGDTVVVLVTLNCESTAK